MPPRQDARTLLAGATIIFSIFSFGLYMYHAQTHCYSEAGGISIHQCSKEAYDICTAGYAIFVSGNIQGYDVTASLTCPLSFSTTISGLVASVATFVLIVFFCQTARGRGLGDRIAILGGGIILLFVISAVLMIADVRNGAKYDTNSKTPGLFAPGTYYTHLLISSVVAVLVGFVTFHGYKTDGASFGGSGVVIGSNIPNQQQENELGEISGDVEGSQSRNGYSTF